MEQINLLNFNMFQFIKEEIQYYLFARDKIFIPESCQMNK